MGRWKIFVLLAVCSSGCLGTVGSKSNVSAIQSRCSAPTGISNAPKSIYEAITLINALPKPLSMGCFIESLEHPLKIQASSSQLSSQPAIGERSPRVFIYFGNLTLTIVASENANTTVEFGERSAYKMAIRGEVAFPVLSVLPTSAPYTAILHEGGTRCVFCHNSETKVIDDPTHTQAFASAVVPVSFVSEVSVESVIHSAETCDSRNEPHRCAVLSAIIGK